MYKTCQTSRRFFVTKDRSNPLERIEFLVFMSYCCKGTLKSANQIKDLFHRESQLFWRLAPENKSVQQCLKKLTEHIADYCKPK